MIEPPYTYKARLKRAIDGDTYELDVDLGFEISHEVTVRLHGIDCPEHNTPEGVKAMTFAATIMNGDLIVKTVKTKSGGDTMSFARYVADVWLPDGRLLATVLREAGHFKEHEHLG